MAQLFSTRSGKMLFVLFALLGAFWLIDRTQTEEGEESATYTVISSFFSRKPIVAANSARGFRGKRNVKTDSDKAGEGDEAGGVAAANSETSATLQGFTYNETGGPVAGVKVTVRRAGTIETVLSGDSNEKGEFSVGGLLPGTYDLLATHDKYVHLIRPSYTIRAQDAVVSMNFHMPLGAMINGKVVNEEDQPVKGVRVASRRYQAQESRQDGKILMDDSTYRTQVTDTPGTFTLAGISQGANVFEFVAPGYAMERMTVDITPEKAAEEMKVVLKKTGMIVGRVLDDNNMPVSTATVSLTRYKPLRTAAENIDKGKMTAVTNENGEFRFEKLFNEGYYDLIVEEERFAPGIYPLVPVNTDRIVCQLTVGGEISGLTKLIDREKTEIGVLLTATSVIKGTTYTAETRSDGGGKFQFKRLPYGTYSLAVDDGKFVSEPKDGVVSEKDKPPVTDAVVELYEVARVSGRVTDSVSEGSVPRAKVTLQATYGLDQARKKTFNIETDAHGLFSFDKLPSGIHVAQAEARGYLKGGTDKSRQSFVLTPGERKNDLVLHLDHGASVDGFVLDPAGRSISDVDIQLFAATTFDGGVNAAPLKGKTDSTGYFKIWGIEVGERVQLYASASKSGFTKTRSDMIELSTSAMEQSIQINMERGGVVTGIVTDRNKMPIPGAEIRFDSHAFPGDPTPSSMVVHSGANGTYTIENCPAGGAGLTVSRAGFVRQGRGVTVRDGEKNDNVNFEMEQGQVIAGHVEDLYGKPIAGATVKATGINGAAGSEQATTDKKGEFELTNLGAGDFRLDATFKLTTPEGEQNYHFINPKVRAGNLFAVVECDLTNTVSGKVKGDKNKGLQNFTVTLSSRGDTKPAQEFSFNLTRGIKDSAGYFRMSKVPRGVYDLRVSADGYEPYKKEEIALGPGARTYLPNIDLVPAGGVVGRVFSATTDRPVNNATVRLVNIDDKIQSDHSNLTISATTNLRGEFRARTVPQGTYRVTIDHPNYIGTQIEMIQVTEKRERDVGKQYLEAGGGIRGTVKNNLGDPLPNMQVIVRGVTPAKQVTTDVAGNFMIQGVQDGRWPIVVRGTMSNKSVYFHQTSFIEKDETKRMDFVLETSADLAGQVYASGEGAVQSGSVSIHPFDENNIALESIRYSSGVASNEYAINEVPPGRYFLWASGQSTNSGWSTWDDLYLNRGSNRKNLEVGTARVEGTLTDETGAPVPNTSVQMIPLFNAPSITQNLYNNLVRNVATDDNGNFVIPNLKAGSYQLLNVSPFTGSWYAQPQFSLGAGQNLSNLNIIVGE